MGSVPSPSTEEARVGVRDVRGCAYRTDALLPLAFLGTAAVMTRPRRRRTGPGRTDFEGDFFVSVLLRKVRKSCRIKRFFIGFCDMVLTTPSSPGSKLDSS